jgi:TPR repeat protein
VFGSNAILDVKMDKKFSPNENTDSQAVRGLAQSGDAEAQFAVGLAIASGGNKSDYAEAAQWFLKAAEQNHIRAQFNLAIMYWKGEGVARDKTLSRMWMSRAAELGDASAQYELGMRQDRLSQDEKAGAALELKIEAYKWVLLAAAQGYSGSRAGCDAVAMNMSHSGVIEGKRRARAFESGTKS